MMKKFIYKPTAEEIYALSLSLPLVSACSNLCASPLQAQINAQCALSALHKLQLHEQLIPNEFRVTALSCQIAVMVLSGDLEVDITPEEKSALSKYFFLYRKLYASFQPALDAFM